MMIEQVMNDYGIHPVEINRVSANVYHVTDGVSQFALKKSSMTSIALNNWQHVYHQAYHSNLPGILPVYLTKDQTLYKMKEGLVFYLTPWLEAVNEELNLELFFKSIGRIHQRTKFTEEISYEKTETEFEKYQVHNEDNYQLLFESVQEFEKKKYMSPFELLICTQFISLERVFHVLNSFIKRFIDERNKHSLWNLNLCHGNLKREHLIQSNSLYIINWEQASYRNALNDLDSFFSNIVSESNIDTVFLIESFENYMEVNELEIDELYLLVIYLLDFQTYMSILESYLNRSRTNYSMIEQIMNLQHTYRKLMFGLKFAEFVDDKDKEFLLDDLES